jgi:hypothetical protein
MQRQRLIDSAHPHDPKTLWQYDHARGAGFASARSQHVRLRALRPHGDAERFIGVGTSVVDAGGRLLLPGFIDSHFHVGLGNDPNVERITGRSLGEIQAQIKAFSDQRPDLKWIEMDGWNYSAFSSEKLPKAWIWRGAHRGTPGLSHRL